MVTSFLVLSIIANTAFLSTPSGYAELCVITVDDVTRTYQGECKDVAKDILNDVQDDHPSWPIEVVINGNNLNSI